MAAVALDAKFKRADLSLTVPSNDDTESPPKPSLRDEIQRRKEEKLQREEAQLTFKPTLSSKGSTRGRSKDEKTGGDVSRFDRLYSDALKRHMEDKYKESVTDKELTFKPKLTSRSRSSSRERSAPSPAPSTSSRLQKQTGTVKNPVVEVKPTFKPTISKRANSIERSRGETQANLYAHSKTAKELQALLKAEQEEKVAESCTFKPHTNVKSRPPSRGRGTPLAERMSKFEEQKKAKIDAEKQRRMEEDKMRNSFTPQVTRRAHSRSSTPTGRVPVHERLTAPSPAKESPEAKQKKYEQELTFQPQIYSKRAPSVRYSHCLGLATFIYFT